MSPRLEARQLQVEQGQVYSVQSHSLKMGFRLETRKLSYMNTEKRSWNGKGFCKVAQN